MLLLFNVAFLLVGFYACQTKAQRRTKEVGSLYVKVVVKHQRELEPIQIWTHPGLQVTKWINKCFACEVFSQSISMPKMFSYYSNCKLSSNIKGVVIQYSKADVPERSNFIHITSHHHPRSAYRIKTHSYYHRGPVSAFTACTLL